MSDNPHLESLRTSGALGQLASADQEVLAPLLRASTVPAGEVLVHEGEADRAVHLIVAGRARVERGGFTLGTASVGDHVGELALLVGRARAASVVAETPLSILTLTHDDFTQLAERWPGVALRLVQALVGGIVDRLHDMTDSVGLLLHERSLPQRATVQVRLGERKLEVRTGTRVGSLLAEHGSMDRVVAALVDQQPTSLGAPLLNACAVEPLSVDHWQGQRIYRESLGLLLLEAAALERPGLPVRMGHSAGFAQRVLVAGVDGEARAELAAVILARMRALVEQDLPLRHELWTLGEARAHFRAVGWDSALSLLESWRKPAVAMASYGSVQTLAFGPLVSRTSALGGFDVAPEADGLLLLYGDKGSSAEEPPSPSAVPGSLKRARLATEQLATMTRPPSRWLATLGIESVGAFNRACVTGSVPSMIRVSEGFQEKRIADIADLIARRAEQVRVVCIAGPSSTGKTTFIKRLSVQLQVNGISPVGVSLDDYYVDRDHTPRDKAGEYDYEAFEALRTDLLQAQVKGLLAGDEVQLARYDFASGVSHPSGGKRLRLRAGDVLLLEGIHGLNPALLATLPAAEVFRIFVCPLTNLPFDRLHRVHASDVRLLRRIVRDRFTRGSDAAGTIQRWPSVRAGERQHIFPFQHHADAVFDTSLVYELSVLKVYAERYLLEVPRDHPSMGVAYSLLQLLDPFVTIYPDQVPSTSILREFIGGSAFDY
ncbi:MAG: cyclic nucleotide-binding domain-containing protein [Myxococcales bacterium]|nr:cyclic nucleotide-binding domain-containing protein [Myxococcales bacterium]MCB9626999.1 cyclic nucleotide-binding domain-containing protein [Sandaracinaceae bacterium]